MGVSFPWLVMVAWLSYQHGYKQGKMPEPHYFLGATAAMSIAALVGSFNKTLGTLFAWALVVGVFVNVTGKTPTVAKNSEKKPIDKAVDNTIGNVAKTGQQAATSGAQAAGTGGQIIGGLVRRIGQ